MSVNFSCDGNIFNRVSHFNGLETRYKLEGFDRVKRHWDFVNRPDGHRYSYSAVVLMATGAFCARAGVGACELGAYYGQRFYKYIQEQSAASSAAAGGALALSSTACKSKLAAGAADSAATKDADSWFSFRNLVVGSVMAVGAYVGFQYYMGATESDNSAFAIFNYELSLAEASERRLEMYSEDQFLQRFECPITCVLMEVPIRIPDGGLFDLESLMKCKRTENGEFRDPYNNGWVDFKDLYIDVEIGYLISKRMLHLVNEEMTLLEAHPKENSTEIINLKSARDSALRATEQKYNFARAAVEKLVNLCRGIPERESYVMNAMKEFESLYGAYPHSTIAWDGNWEDTTRSRYKIAMEIVDYSQSQGC